LLFIVGPWEEENSDGDDDDDEEMAPPGTTVPTPANILNLNACEDTGAATEFSE